MIQASNAVNTPSIRLIFSWSFMQVNTLQRQLGTRNLHRFHAPGLVENFEQCGLELRLMAVIKASTWVETLSYLRVFAPSFKFHFHHESSRPTNSSPVPSIWLRLASRLYTGMFLILNLYVSCQTNLSMTLMRVYANWLWNSRSPWAVSRVRKFPQ